MTALNEELLETWLDLSAVLRNERFMAVLSFNEASICARIEKQRKEHPDHPYLTIKELGAQTRMLKSQVNRTVTSLEQKGLVRRVRREGDRRLVYVCVVEAELHTYLQEHERILGIVDRIIGGIGTHDAVATIGLLRRIIVQIDQILHEGEV